MQSHDNGVVTDLIVMPAHSFVRSPCLVNPQERSHHGSLSNVGKWCNHIVVACYNLSLPHVESLAFCCIVRPHTYKPRSTSLLLRPRHMAYCPPKCHVSIRRLSNQSLYNRYPQLEIRFDYSPLPSLVSNTLSTSSFFLVGNCVVLEVLSS